MNFTYLWIAAQIIFEMVPISSSGHLVLLELIIKKYFSVDLHALWHEKKIDIKTVYYFLHGPTLLILILYCGPVWFDYLKNSSFIKPILWVTLSNIITLFIYLLHKKIKISFALGFGFIITAFTLFFTAWCTGGKSVLAWEYSDAFILGCAQGIALLPGISRLAFTIATGCWLGFSLLDAFFISWLIAFPLMAAAWGKSIIQLSNEHKLMQVLNPRMALVMLGSSVSSWLLLLFIVHLITAHAFFYIGWYMIVPLLLWMRLKNK